MNIEKVLVIGYSTRYIVCSGKRAGYKMYAIDHFDDLDLLGCADFFLLFGKQPLDIPSEKEIIDYIGDLKIEFDAIILGALFERMKLDKLRDFILNNEFKVMKKATNKAWVSKQLDRLDIPHPKTYTLDNMGYPSIAKPKFGAGGAENFLIKNESDLPPDPSFKDSYLFQEYIFGKPASVSLISTKDEVVPIAINEQIIGKKWLGQTFPFAYCGNITPFIPSRTEIAEVMCEIAKDLILELGLVGSNGVDFIVTDDEVFVIEVNPRFQSSLDTVELSTGINIFDAHVRAFDSDSGGLGDLGGLVDKLGKTGPKKFASKAIVYANQEFVLKKDLNKIGIADITPVGRAIFADDPVATAIGVGKSRAKAICSTMENVFFIKRAIRGSFS